MKFTVRPHLVPPNHEDIECCPKLVWELWHDEVIKDYTEQEWEHHEFMGRYPNRDKAEEAARMIAEFKEEKEYTYEV